MISWVVWSFAMVLTHDIWWQQGLAIISVAAALAGVAFNVGHDFGHGAGTNSKLHGSSWVIKLLDWTGRATFDAIGASSFAWRVKHAIAHHTYTNVSGHDSDIDQAPFVKLDPEQEHRPMYRFQHLYGPFMYGFLTVKWHWAGDLKNLKKGRIASSEIPKMKLSDKLLFIGGKLFTLSWMILFPCLVLGHSIIEVLIVYLAITYVLGFIIAIVFQLAHAVDGAKFEKPNDDGNIETAWEIHQVETTRDFHYAGKFLHGTINRMLNFYLGGLDHQTIHHIFPKVPHTLYRHIKHDFAKLCADNDVLYVNQPIGKALRDHLKWLKKMGAEPTTTP